MVDKVKERRCEIGTEVVILCTRALHEAGLEHSGSFNIVTSSLRVKVVRRAKRHYLTLSSRAIVEACRGLSGGAGLRP